MHVYGWRILLQFALGFTTEGEGLAFISQIGRVR